MLLFNFLLVSEFKDIILYYYLIYFYHLLVNKINYPVHPLIGGYPD
jgi:hypothetical protein